MNKELCKLYPSKLWENFANICAIPHPSKHEAKILEWLKTWAKENEIECQQDEVGNLLMSKPATLGMENRMPIILQGHIDMVPQANSDKNHDFTTDPIEPIIGEDGWIRANGTTLGADNGIGCAAAMALLQSKDVAHGALEVLITVDEETGMTGAFGLKKGFVKGQILMNLDSEDEGELYVGCAGGMDANIEMTYTAEPATGLKGYEIAITGLKGGHSGMDINLGRANANKVMVRILKQAEEFNLRVASINGGSLRNAIPREAFVCVGVPADKTADFTAFIQQFTAVVSKEFAGTEPDISIQLREQNIENVMENGAQTRLINLLYALPHGVMRMSDAMENLVETSTNLAIVKVENGKVLVANLLRSSVDSAKEALGLKMTSIAEMAEAKIELTGAYPGWKPNMASPILKTMLQVYEDKFGKKPEVKAIHAGLECGLFGVSYNWDMISFGPTIRHPHSPDEKVNIESVGKFWDFLVETVKNVPVS